MYKENDYLMWLSCIFSIGVVKMNKLIEYFESAQNIWNASAEEINKVINVSEKILHNFIVSKTSEIMEERLCKLQRLGIKFIGISEDEYPSLLREIANPPIGLYVLGDLPKDDIPKVSIIGSRKHSAYGYETAFKISKELARKGIIIVSGMAEGIDGVAHQGALFGNGKTIAVLGNGVDICYPAVNAKLREKIIQNGCLISEYPPGVRPKPYYFPVRNRIISGMSYAVAVIEARKKSGTLITVGQALEQGRDVFAVPGNITSDKSAGTNELLKQGAFVLTSADDILFSLGFEADDKNTDNDSDNYNRINNQSDNKINNSQSNNKTDDNINNNQSNEKISNKVNNKTNNGTDNKKVVQTLATDEKLVYDCIGLNPISIDELFIKTQKEMNNLQYILMMLEFKGIIKKISGQRYARS